MGLRSFRFKNKELFRSLVGEKNESIEQISSSERKNFLYLERNDCGTKRPDNDLRHVLLGGQVTEWTTPTKKRFAVSVSPYIACVEALASDDEEADEDVEETTSASHTPRVRSRKLTTKSKGATNPNRTKAGMSWQ